MTSSRDTHAVSRRRISTRIGIAVAAFLLAFAGIGASAMAAAPTNDVLPEINDTTPQDGQTISTTTGDWSGGVDSYAYQWQTSPNGSTGWSDIGGATSFQFTVSGCRDYLRVRVTATNPDGSTGAIFAATDGNCHAWYGPATGSSEPTPVRVAAPASLADARFCESVESGHSNQDDSAQIAARLGRDR